MSDAVTAYGGERGLPGRLRAGRRRRW